MKSVYRADAVKHIFVSSDVVPDDYVLQANETFEDPSGKVTPAKLSGTTWLDATQEERDAYFKEKQDNYLRQHPELAQPSQPEDTKGTEALGALGKQVGQLVIYNQKNTQAVQALGAQIAGLIAKSNTNGGN